MKVFVINLSRASDRWAFTCENLKSAGLEFVRVEAIDGSHLLLPHPNVSERGLRWMHGSKPNMALVGSYLSHLNALKQFLDSGDNFGVIAEDDIAPQDFCRKAIEESLEYAEYWDIVRLSGLRHIRMIRHFPIAGGRSLGVSLTRLTGAGAYLVNRNAAETMIQKLRVMKLPFDHAFDREWTWGLRAMVVFPFPFKQKFKKRLPSQISDHSRNFKYPALFRYWSVFPFRAYTEGSRLAFRSFLAFRMGRKIHPRASTKSEAPPPDGPGC